MHSHPYKKGQLVSYKKGGELFIDRVSDVGRTWVELRDEKDLMYPSDIVDILDDVAGVFTPARAHTEHHTAPSQRMQHGQGTFAYDNKLKPLHEQITAFLHGAMSVSKQSLIDRAIDTGDKELFLRLTTQHT
jgi:hypothetical protein